MATVREIRARFVGEVTALRTAFRTIQTEASRLGPAVQRSTDVANRSYDSLGTNADKLRRRLQEAGNVEVFDNLNRSAEQAQREFETTGRVSQATMEDMQRETQEASRYFDSLSDDARSSFSDIETAVNDVIGDMNRLGSTDGLNNIRDDATRTAGELDDLADAARRTAGEVDDIDSGSMDELSNSANDAGGSLGSLVSGAGGGVIGAVGGGMAVAAGAVGLFVAAGAGLYGFVKSSDTLKQAVNGLQTQTGATTAEIDEMRDSLVTIYGNNFGDSFEDIADSMANVKQQTNLSGSELEAFTQNAIMMRDTFEYDVAESTKAASILMKQFGIDGDEAFALIAEGTQQGLNYADDLLDSIGEYSVYYEQAGFSAQEMFGMFKNAQETGAFNIDYAADAFKEFGIIMTEDSEKASDALGLLKLDGGKLRAEFAKGGDSARAAFEKIATKLGEVEDPLKRNAIGVELFGTKFEDLGADAVIAMAQTNTSIKGTQDSLDDINSIKYDTIGEALAGVGRSAIANVLIPIQDKLMPGVNKSIGKVTGTITTAMEAFKAFMKGDESAEDVLLSYGLDPKKFQPVIDGIETVRRVFGALKDVLSGEDETVENIFWAWGLGPDSWSSVTEGIEVVKSSIKKLKDFAKTSLQAVAGFIVDNLVKAWPYVLDAMKTAVAFITNNLRAITSFWQTNGEQIGGTLKKIADKIQEVFVAVWPYVKATLKEVVGFIKGIVDKIMTFWDENGSQILEAVTNAFNGIMKVIKFVMPVVLAIIKTVWGNIKGVINGALNIIMGVVKVFSGLFTGDFKKMWEGVKQLFKGAVEFVWNFIQLTFYGKILKGAKVFISAFRSGFASLWAAVKALFQGNGTAIVAFIKRAWNDMWGATKAVFTNISNFLKNTWGTIKSMTTTFLTAVKLIFTKGWSFIKSATTNTFTSVWNFLKSIWNTVRTFVQNTLSGIVSFLRNSWNRVFSTTKTIFTNVWNFFKNIFGNIRTFLNTSVGDILTKIKNTWNTVYSTTTRVFRNIFNAIKDRFTDIVNAAKSLPGRIGDGIGAMASKVGSGITKVINFMARTLGKGINGVISGLNTVLDKIGVDTEIKKWKVPQWAKGTPNGGHPGGLALVNDGVGSNAGPELIKTPDGKMGTLPGKNVVTPLPKGTQVLSATKTREYLKGMPAYGWGTDMFDGAKNLYNKGKAKVKSGISSLKNWTVDVFDYIKNPSKLLTLAFDKLGIKQPTGSGLVSSMAKGAFGTVKTAAVSAVKKALNFFGADGGGGTTNFGGKFRKSSSYGYRIHPITGVRTFHNGDDYAAPSGTPIPNQAAGKVTYAGYHSARGNYVRIKSGNYERLYQHNARNMVKLGEMVKKGQTVGTVGSTGQSTGAHLHYELFKNGENIRPGSLAGNVGKANPKGARGGEGVSAAAKYLAMIIGEGDWLNDWATHVPKSKMSSMLTAGKKAANYMSSYGSPARKYFEFIVDDGDWMNDWATHIPKNAMNGMLSVGKVLANMQGYENGGIVSGKMGAQLAWLTEGGFAESIISHDPSKRSSQQAIWEKTGQELDFMSGDSTGYFARMVTLLEKISQGTIGEVVNQYNLDASNVDELMEIIQLFEQLTQAKRKG